MTRDDQAAVRRLLDRTGPVHPERLERLRARAERRGRRSSVPAVTLAGLTMLVAVLAVAALVGRERGGGGVGSTADPSEGCPVTQPVMQAPPEQAPGSWGHRDPLGVGAGWFRSADRMIWSPNATYLREEEGGKTYWWNKLIWVKPVGSRLEITGRRLDGRASPLEVETPDGYPGDYQASVLRFPAPGCWRVDARAAGSTLRYVVYVRAEP